MCLTAALLLHSTAVFSGDLAKEREKKYRKALTPEAVGRFESRVKQMKPGQRLGEKAFGLKFLILEDKGKEDYLCVGDAWIPAMSGGISGGLTGLGQYCGRDSVNIWGEHFFGYVWGNMTLVPKYRVLTRASLISSNEYARRKKETSVGKLEGKSATAYFADPVFVECQPIPGNDPGQAEGATARAIDAGDLAKYPEPLCTDAFYQEATTVLEALTPGTRMWELPARLDGVLISTDYGQSYSLQMKGFLNTDAMGPWATTHADGKYEVWTFGTMSGGKESPRHSVVFRNGSLVEVKPFTPREELTGQLH
jgi:hypothetical protein